MAGEPLRQILPWQIFLIQLSGGISQLSLISFHRLQIYLKLESLQGVQTLFDLIRLRELASAKHVLK